MLVDHSVSDDEFVIKINYDKSQFEHRINEFVGRIIREAQNSDLYRYNWKVHRLLCEEIEESESYFGNSIIITFTVV